MRLRGGVRVGLAAAALTLVLASCSSSDDGVRTVEAPVAPEDAHRVAVDPTAVGASGTHLAPGVEVVAGSSLIGPTFPLTQWTGEGENVDVGWQAVIVVDADPVGVWNGYVDQLGIGDRASAEQACIVSQRGSPQLMPPRPSGYDDKVYPAPPTTATPTRFLTEPVIDGEDRIECRAAFDGIDLTMIVGQDGCGLVMGDEIAPACLEHEIAHLYVQVQTDPDAEALRSLDSSLGTDETRYERTEDTDGAGRDGWAPIPEGDVVEPQLGEPQPSRLPVSGERVDDGLDYFLGDRGDPSGGLLVVPSEATSLVAPAMLGFCNSGLVAVLSVPGPPEQAVDSFGINLDGKDPIVVTDADPAWALLSASSAGGYGLELLVVAQPDGTSAVLATECGD